MAVCHFSWGFFFFFFQAEDGIRDVERSRGLGDVYKRQVSTQSTWELKLIAWNVGCGLRDMHAMNCMHRDIKPKNILIIKDKEKDGKLIDAKLCDYGLGKKVSETEQMLGSTILGTFDYFAPELYELMEKMMAGLGGDMKYDNKVDVWSYGILLYFCAYGKTPLEPPGSKIKVMKQHIISYPPISSIPDSFINVIKKCLEFDPKHRPSFTELLKDPFFSSVMLVERSNTKPYTKKELLGESFDGKTKVYRCIKGKEQFAMKVMYCAGIDQKRFLAEIDTLYKLRNSNNVVLLQDYFLLKGELYLIMNFYSGGDLEKYVYEKEKKGQIISVDQQIKIAYEILQGLYDIHTHSIIHRDIHPKNILLETDSSRNTVLSLAISDFGFARILHDDEIGKTKIGSYRSPELALPEQSGVHDKSTDIWSYGMVLYFLMFGIHAENFLQNKTMEIYRKGIINYRADRPNVSEDLLGIMKSCLKLKPGERPSAETLLKHKIFDTFRK
eukprot:TRINITY_DN3991_c0_g1_i1.p1 TRINITY_DN3991_c0_g1~~TRINITY_DN3991_c0_g1_i1.p1  ORF type:complete len:498 (-),score=100.11 TRINITY_DN3991_c0_g1_i1:45-1538(-)